MRNSRHSKDSQSIVHNVIYRTAGVLLILAMLSVWMLSGLYARYVVSERFEDSATVQKTGVGNLELLEHEAVLIENTDKALQQDSVYELTNNEVTENKYDVVLPGVDIPKDPFIRITKDSTASADETSVTYNLYLKIVKENLPDTVTYEIAEGWEPVESENAEVYTYKYNEVIDSKFSGTIYILKDNKLEVKEGYVGNGKTFSLTFDAWVKQIEPN